MPLSKPFVIATSGPTIDGRVITREQISQMAASYDPKTYTAVVNLEHYLSMMPDSTFSALGKVMSLSTQEVELMGEKKLQLLAVVDAADSVVALQKQGKKAFSSVEIINNFINKGIAYLAGLAFTDNPASIGTESMKFSVSGAQGERFACDTAVEIVFEQESKGDGLFAKVKDLLGMGKKDTDARFADTGLAVEAIAGSQKDLIDQVEKLSKTIAEQAEAFKTASADAAKQAEDFATFKAKLEGTENHSGQRPPAKGGDGQVTTDC